MLNENNGVWEYHPKEMQPGVYEWRFYHAPGKHLFKTIERDGAVLVLKHRNAQDIPDEFVARIGGVLRQVLDDFPTADKCTVSLSLEEKEILLRLGNLPVGFVVMGEGA